MRCFSLRHLPTVLTVVVLSICANQVFARDAVGVERLIGQAARGRPPVLWLSTDPEYNRGSGPGEWQANSGGRLVARGTDAWGRTNAAFGLSVDAEGGAALAGSTACSPISPKAGSVVLFFRVDAAATPPQLLFSNSDWGQPNFLSLRINAVHGRQELTLGVSDQSVPGKAVQTSFATLAPGSWNFVALVWEEVGGGCLFRLWAGDLESGELTEGERRVPPFSDRPGLFLLAGRRADTVASYRTQPLLFSGGLYSNIAIFDEALTEDMVKRIYTAATLR